MAAPDRRRRWANAATFIAVVMVCPGQVSGQAPGSDAGDDELTQLAVVLAFMLEAGKPGEMAGVDDSPELPHLREAMRNRSGVTALFVTGHAFRDQPRRTESDRERDLQLAARLEVIFQERGHDLRAVAGSSELVHRRPVRQQFRTMDGELAMVCNTAYEPFHSECETFNRFDLRLGIFRPISGGNASMVYVGVWRDDGAATTWPSGSWNLLLRKVDDAWKVARVLPPIVP